MNLAQKIENFMAKELEKGTFPGAVLAIVNQEKTIYKRAFGYAQFLPEEREMKEDTIFDLASLTKVIATTTAIMQLIERGKLNLWDYIKEFFPGLPEDKEEITVFHLLTHTSGYQAIVRLWERGMEHNEKINYILNLPLEREIGEEVNYSDPNFILLGEIVRKVSGQSIDRYTRDNIFLPLGMEETTFNPIEILKVDKKRFAATEWCDWRKKMVVGEVHDENSASFGGISGHAGLFSTIDDLIKFVRMVLNDGTAGDKQVLIPETIKMMRRNWTKDKSDKRGLGWDLRDNFRSSGGVLMSPESFGHTGFTGTSIWIDPAKRRGIILLSNRVHPSRNNVKIISLRPRLHNLITATLAKTD